MHFLMNRWRPSIRNQFITRLCSSERLLKLTSEDKMLLYDVQCVFLCISSSVPGRLRQFVLDLHSGKLHREFHHGPDPTDSTPGQVRPQRQHALRNHWRLASLCQRSTYLFVLNLTLTPQEETGGEAASSPPESSFQKLAPSETRYTILRRDRDELWPQQPSSDPVTQCHAPGSGRGLGLGQASGTEQQHPTPLLKRERDRDGEEEEWGEKKNSSSSSSRRRREECSPRHNHVGITYIFITLSRTIFILDQKEVG